MKLREAELKRTLEWLLTCPSAIRVENPQSEERAHGDISSLVQVMQPMGTYPPRALRFGQSLCSIAEDSPSTLGAGLG